MNAMGLAVVVVLAATMLVALVLIRDVVRNCVATFAVREDAAESRAELHDLQMRLLTKAVESLEAKKNTSD